MIATAEPGYLPGLRRLRGRVEVTAIASRTRSRAEQVARDWDIPAIYDGLGPMLAAPDVDAVVLARASLVEHLADCLDTGTQPRPSAARARHVLEIMLAARTAAATGRTVPLTTTFEP